MTETDTSNSQANSYNEKGAPDGTLYKEQEQWQDNNTTQNVYDSTLQFTWRSFGAGCFIGAIMCFSNMYFGLQTGWVTMGSLQSSVLGFGLFKLLKKWTRFGHNFTHIENVLLQTTAVACATMPLAGGFVGIIPALGMLTKEEGGAVHLSYGQLLLWSIAVAFFGVFFAVPLRKQTILREKLRFPSAVATAEMIRVLHKMPAADSSPSDASSTLHQRTKTSSSETKVEETYPSDTDIMLSEEIQERAVWRKRWIILGTAFSSAALVTLIMHFAEDFQDIKFFSWFGWSAATAYGWTITPSAGYVGQGMIMGPRTVVSMLLGALLGWGFLAPLSHHTGWAPGKINNSEDGPKGFITWISLAIMLADSLTGLSYICFKWFRQVWRRRKSQTTSASRDTSPLLYSASSDRKVPNSPWSSSGVSMSEIDVETNRVTYTSSNLQDSSHSTILPSQSVLSHHTSTSSDHTHDQMSSSNISNHTPTDYDAETKSPITPRYDEPHPIEVAIHDPAPPYHQVPTSWWLSGLIVSTILCVAIVSPLFDMPVYEPIVAVIVALLVAVLAVRALGETDLNPVSGVGKLSQGVFAGLSPGRLVPNLLAGAIAEAGAQQAGDMMQDLKTGHLMSASPRAQFYAQVMGSGISIFFTLAAYWLYTTAYTVPGPVFAVPTARIWLDMAEVVNGAGLPPSVLPACGIAALFGIILSVAVIILPHDRSRWLPSGVAMAVGMYVTPNWTIARVAGGILEFWLRKRHPSAHKKYMILIASGFVLGEGVMSIVTAALTAGGH